MSVEGAVLLLGARSEIGIAVAVRLIAEGHRSVVLAARRSDDLQEQTDRLFAAGATIVHCVEFDADDLGAHKGLVRGAMTAHGPITVVVFAFGILGDQALAEHDAEHAVSIVHTDYVAHVSLLTHVANELRAQRSGEIVVFSSVAGARVRRANYVYGSAKAGLDGFATGLASALTGSGVHLLLIRPGFVIGRMTQGMKPAPWSSTPDQVADAVLQGLRKGRDVVWVPPVLRWVFAGLRLLPQSVWRRLPR